MKAVIDWIRSWWSGAKVVRQMSALDRKIDRCLSAIADSNRNIDKITRRIDDDRDRLLAETARVKRLLKDTKETLEIANEAIKMRDDILIPGLVSGHQVLIDRWNAESAVFAMRQAAVSQKEVE